MNLETENEKLRTRLAEMAAEVERLQSVIDAANAQVVRAENAPRVATSDKVLFNGSHGHAGYVIEEQQSPAVTVPDFETWWRNLPSYRDADKPAAKMAWDYLAGQISGFQSPSITEQDVREIAESVFLLFGDLREDEYQLWMEKHGSSILDKLKGDKNA